MNPETSRILNIVQMISEVCIAAGFFIGVIPFVYAWSGTWGVPLSIVSLIIALVNRNNTLTFTIANVVLGILSFIPIFGIATRIIYGIPEFIAYQDASFTVGSQVTKHSLYF